MFVKIMNEAVHSIGEFSKICKIFFREGVERKSSGKNSTNVKHGEKRAIYEQETGDEAMQRAEWLIGVPNRQKIKKLGRFFELKNAGNKPKKLKLTSMGNW